MRDASVTCSSGRTSATGAVWIALHAAEWPTIDLGTVVGADPSRRLVLLDPAEPLDDRAAAELRDVEVALARHLPATHLAAAPRLRWVQCVHSGVDGLVGGPDGLAGLAVRGVRVTNAAGIGTDSVAEFVVARLLSHWKHLPRLADLQRGRRWEPVHGRRVAGSTIALVGLGGVGLEIARRASALGMRVLAVRRRSDEPGGPAVDQVVAPNCIKDIFAVADAAVVCLPATSETRHLIGGAELAALPRGAFFANVSRGSLVDTAALLRACRSGHLGMAALDVFEDEPLPSDHPLWSLPNVEVSAHCATAVDGYLDGVVDLFAQNLRSERHGSPLRNPVDLERGY